jgi:hypothetical protein
MELLFHRRAGRAALGRAASNARCRFDFADRLGHEDQFINALTAEYTARIADAANFAKRNRVLLLETADGVGIDISMGAMPFELSAIERASDYSFEPGYALRTCSAEDLLVFKVFASRPLDLRDAEGVIVRNYKTLDWRYIEEQLTPLAELKEEPELLTTLARLKKLRP